MPKVSLYISMAAKDVFRLWSATQLQVIIISGICLPILLLLGLKNGHVAELREELATSPTGRQVIFWAARDGDLLSDDVIDRIDTSIDNVDVIIPESQKLIFAQSPTDAAPDGEQPTSSGAELSLTLYSSLPGDPLLQQFGIENISGDELEIVLSQTAAEDAGVEVEDMLSVRVSRRLGADSEDHFLEFKVIGVMPSREQGRGQSIGYSHLSTLEKLDAYTAGDAVESLGIPAMKGRKATDLYESMLLFAFKGVGSDLNDEDISFLEGRGLEVERIDSTPLSTLFGALKPTSTEELSAYRLNRVSWEEPGISAIRDTTQLLVRNTKAEDDLVIRWVDPLFADINGIRHKILGLSLPTKRETGGWLNTFYSEDANWFTFEESVENPLRIHVDESGTLAAEPVLTIKTESGVEIQCVNAALQSEAELDEKNETGAAKEGDEIVDDDLSDDQSSTPKTEESEIESAVNEVPIAYVPVNLLAYIRQLEDGLVKFDAASGNFIDVPAPVSFTKARLYTRTIDDVPDAVQWLSGENYAVLSESSRIAEIQEQDQSLQMLVVVVALGVFVFGVVTVFSVLVDSTDRKKGTIGILRVMGMSRFGVFSIVLFRAFVIGLLAAFMCVLVGFGLAEFLRADLAEASTLTWKPVVNVIINPADALLIAGGALLCASLGAVVPALRASGLDPFDAITEGQFG